MCFCSSERSDVRCPGDVQDRQQGHQTRKSPHPGLHGWIQRYSFNYTVGCSINEAFEFSGYSGLKDSQYVEIQSVRESGEKLGVWATFLIFLEKILTLEAEWWLFWEVIVIE